MVLGLFENDPMRHGMRHRQQTVSESTRFETSAAREKESLIIQTVRNIEVTFFQFASPSLPPWNVPIRRVGQKPPEGDQDLPYVQKLPQLEGLHHVRIRSQLITPANILRVVSRRQH